MGGAANAAPQPNPSPREAIAARAVGAGVGAGVAGGLETTGAMVAARTASSPEGNLGRGSWPEHPARTQARGDETDQQRRQHPCMPSSQLQQSTEDRKRRT